MIEELSDLRDRLAIEFNEEFMENGGYKLEFRGVDPILMVVTSPRGYESKLLFWAKEDLTRYVQRERRLIWSFLEEEKRRRLRREARERRLRKRRKDLA